MSYYKKLRQLLSNGVEEASCFENSASTHLSECVAQCYAKKKEEAGAAQADDKREQAACTLMWGVSSLLAFVQGNFTGPEITIENSLLLDEVQALLSGFISFFHNDFNNRETFLFDNFIIVKTFSLTIL